MKAAGTSRANQQFFIPYPALPGGRVSRRLCIGGDCSTSRAKTPAPAGSAAGRVARGGARGQRPSLDARPLIRAKYSFSQYTM